MNPISDPLSDFKQVAIDYTNWRGERRKRKILPINILFGTTSYHPGFQWLLRAIDLESTSNTVKEFSVKDIHSWEPNPIIRSYDE